MRKLVKEVNLLKPGLSEKFRGNSIRVRINNMQLLDIGGQEGPKFRAKIKIKNYENIYFVKEFYEAYDKGFVEDCLRSFILLKKHNFPVPDVLRYFIDDSKLYLVMSDMTENGKYRMWGYSDCMSQEQTDELREMNLTGKDLKVIENKALRIAHKAGNLNFRLEFYNYHIRKHKKTGAMSICLLDVLDVDSYVYSPKRASQYNLTEVSRFMEFLKFYNMQ